MTEHVVGEKDEYQKYIEEMTLKSYQNTQRWVKFIPGMTVFIGTIITMEILQRIWFGIFSRNTVVTCGLLLDSFLLSLFVALILGTFSVLIVGFKTRKRNSSMSKPD
jgi:hypothetical protein